MTTLSIAMAIVIVILLVTGIALYFVIKKPAPAATEGAISVTVPKPPVAEIIADYERSYDADEYCVDEEIYDMRCEETCKASGEQVMAKAAFLDCPPPRQCCRYPPAEWWPSFEEAPGEGG